MILADAHVHIHSCFKLPVFLDSASMNFEAEAKRRGQVGNRFDVLLLTESAGENWFHRLADGAGSPVENDRKPEGGWSFHPTQEECSLRAEQHEAGRALFVVAGRQIVTRENLEVLALGTTRGFEDGGAMGETIHEVAESGAIPVIPWGPGKWLGRRGRIVTELIDSSRATLFFLGDNGGRPVFHERPAMFQLAKARGIRILPGSDPLPLTSQGRRAGSFGFAAMEAFSAEEPFRTLKHIIRNPSSRLEPYGRLERPLPFLRNQLMMQLLKHRRKHTNTAEK